MIPQETIDRIREASDISEIISQYVTLKPTGKGFKGLCPFHTEKTPSFTVNVDRQFFYCFGCRAGGNIFHFLMRAEGLDFLEAVRQLAQRAHIALPASGGAAAADADHGRQRLLDACAWAAERFRQALLSSQAGGRPQAYLRQRGVSPEMSERFGLGYAPAAWDNLLKAGQRDHFSESLLAQAGLIVPRQGGEGYYDRFRDRLMFPIRDHQGRPVAFGGRLLEPGEPKYLNSSESPIFHKGEVLFGLDLARDAARKTGRLVMVEGYLDALACQAAGVSETVAVLGTALTPQQVRLARRYAERVVLIFDADEAGRTASLRAFELANQEGLSLQAVAVPGAKDPDEFLRLRGAEAFRQLLAKTQGVVEFVLQAAMVRNDPSAIEGKLAILNQVLPFLALQSNAVERREYLRLVAERLHLDEATVAEELRRRSRRPVAEIRTPAPEPEPPRRARAEEEMLLATLLRHPAKLEKYRNRLDLDYFQDLNLRALAEQLFAAPGLEPEADEERWLQRLLGGLAEPGQAQTAAGLLARETGGADPERVLQDCLNRLEAFQVRERIRVLQAQIRDADAQGEFEILKQLQQQEIEWKNRLKHLGVDWRPGRGNSPGPKTRGGQR